MENANLSSRIELRSRLIERLPELILSLSSSGSTYNEIADLLDLSKNTVKNIATQRVKVPRANSLDRVGNNLRHLRSLNLSASVTKIVDDLLGADFEEEGSLYFSFLNTMFGLDKNELAKRGGKIAGEYACYRFSGAGQSVVKTKLTINRYDETQAIQTAKIEYFTTGGTKRTTDGFVWAQGNAIVILGAMEEGRGVVFLIIDDIFDPLIEVFPGLGLSKTSEKRAVGTRILFLPINNKNYQKVARAFGHVDFSIAVHEVGKENVKMMYNNVDKYSVMRTFYDI